jgi:hypothetical protein
MAQERRARQKRMWLGCLLAGLAGLAMAGAGCGSDSGDDEASDRTRASGERANAANTSTTAEPPSSTTSTTIARPRAADGTNIAACADGNCEVELSGPVDIPLTGQGGGITMLSVTEVTADDFRFTTTSGPGQTGSGGLGEGCISRLTSNSASSGCPGPDPNQPLPAEPGVLSLQPVSLTNGSAIVRLASA